MMGFQSRGSNNNTTPAECPSEKWPNKHRHLKLLSENTELAYRRKEQRLAVHERGLASYKHPPAEPDHVNGLSEEIQWSLWPAQQTSTGTRTIWGRCHTWVHVSGPLVCIRALRLAPDSNKQAPMSKLPPLSANQFQIHQYLPCNYIIPLVSTVYQMTFHREFWLIRIILIKRSMWVTEGRGFFGGGWEGRKSRMSRPELCSADTQGGLGIQSMTLRYHHGFKRKGGSK